MTVAASVFEENLALAREEFRRRPLVMRSAPTFLGVILTTRCHLDCLMCHRVKVKGELPAGFAGKLRPLLPSLEQLHWQGGEAFLYPGFDALLEEAGSWPNVSQFLVTAGLLIDRDWAERLAGARCGLTFSVDSAVPATYERIRVGARFTRLERALARLRQAEAGRPLPKTLHAVVMAENAADVSSVVGFALRHGMSHVDLTPRLPLDDAPSLFAPGNERRYRAEREALIGQLEKARQEATRAGLGFTDRVGPLLGIAAPQAAPQAWDCWMPWRGLYVSADYDDGAIMPDCMCHPKPVGHIGRDALLDAWNSPAMREYRKRVLAKEAEGWCNAACHAGGVNPAAWFASSFRTLSIARP